MNNNGKTPILDLQYNLDYQVKFLGYKTGENTYGPWHFYQFEHNGEKYGHFAQPNLHQKLSKFSEGDFITIRKEQTEKDGYEWVINGKSNSQPTPTVSKPLQITFDERTHDIHRQVCLKVVGNSFPRSDRPWDNEVVQEFKRRTDSLMVVLEGETQDDLPF